jgi:hypothetical protein
MFRTSYFHHQEDHNVHAVLYGTFSMHLCKQSSINAWKRTVQTACTVQYGLPDDEHMMFETCRGQEELH